MRFVGKKVLVTNVGCNTAGRLLATAFAKEGADIAIHYHCRPEIAAEIIDDLYHAGTRAIALQADLKTPVAARNLVRQAAERLSGLDILILTAATVLRRSHVEVTDNEWGDSFDINLRAASVSAHEAARLMLENETAGRIVMIGSAVRYQTPRKEMTNQLNTHDLLKLAREMALELAANGITVNVIDPGLIRANANRPAGATLVEEELQLDDIPMARIGMPEDVIEPALFLASPGAAYVTGNIIFCDGGVMLRQLAPENLRADSVLI